MIEIPFWDLWAVALALQKLAELTRKRTQFEESCGMNISSIWWNFEAIPRFACGLDTALSMEYNPMECMFNIFPWSCKCSREATTTSNWLGIILNRYINSKILWTWLLACTDHNWILFKIIPSSGFSSIDVSILNILARNTSRRETQWNSSTRNWIPFDARVYLRFH